MNKNIVLLSPSPSLRPPFQAGILLFGATCYGKSPVDYVSEDEIQEPFRQLRQSNGGVPTRAVQTGESQWRVKLDDLLSPESEPLQTRDGYPVLMGKKELPGSADTYMAYGEPWAHVSNITRAAFCTSGRAKANSYQLRQSIRVCTLILNPAF